MKGFEAQHERRQRHELLDALRDVMSHCASALEQKYLARERAREAAAAAPSPGAPGPSRDAVWGWFVGLPPPRRRAVLSCADAPWIALVLRLVEEERRHAEKLRRRETHLLPAICLLYTSPSPRDS